jgi:hypothetical protein
MRLLRCHEHATGLVAYLMEPVSLDELRAAG